MLDEVRKADWTPRSVHRSVREVAEAIRRLENATGEEARPADIARTLQMSLEDYYRIMQDAASCRLFSFDQMGTGEDETNPAAHAADEGPGPAEQLEEDEFRGALAAAIRGLPEREQLVLSLYYDDELNLREIGAVLDVSESRICQIHGQAMVRLRARIQQWMAGR
jgi:RNA polymerase sigma factor for flagellar operon FliA